MEAIKRNARPYLWQINGAGLIIWAVSKWSSPSFFSDREVSLKSHNIIQLGDNYPRSRTAHACKYCMDACSVILKPRPPQPQGCDIGWGEKSPPVHVFFTSPLNPSPLLVARLIWKPVHGPVRPIFWWMRLLTAASVCSNPSRCHSGASTNPIIIFLPASQIRLKDN